MPKPNLKVTAAKLAEVAQKSGGVFVFATRDANLPRVENVSAEIAEYPFAEHTCKSCSAVFSAVKAEGMQNHCIACASDQVTAGKDCKPNIPSDDSLSFVTCASCGTHSVLADAIGKEVASGLKCTACGTSLAYQATADEDVDDDGTLDIDDMNLLDIDGDGDADDAPAVTAEEEEKKEEKAEDTSTDDPTAPAQPLAPGAPATGEPPPSSNQDEPPNPDAKAPSEANVDDMMDLDMMDTVTEDSPDPMTFAYLGKKMAILSGLKIVATLSPEDAGDNAELMQTEAFRQSVAHVITNKGLKEAAKHFGFKGVQVPVPVKAMVAAGVEKATAEQKGKVTAALDDAAKSFQQALDISAAGFAGNFWRGKHDPVKAALIHELTASGVSNPNRLIDRIFETHGVSQMREVLAHARELANKPAEALNGLAQALNLSKYLPTEVTASDDEDKDDAEEDQDEDDDEESTVTTVAHAVTDVPSAETAKSQYKSKALASILGADPIFN